MKQYVCYTDGSCGPTNPGTMGLGILKIECDLEGESIKGTEEIISLSMGDGTNNRAELLACIAALKSFPKEKRGDTRVVVYSDSNYVVQGMTSWIYNWIENRRLGMGKNPVKNVDLWRVLYNLRKEFCAVKFTWIKGHSDNPYNSVVDSLAKQGYLQEDMVKVASDKTNMFDKEFEELRLGKFIDGTARLDLE